MLLRMEREKGALQAIEISCTAVFAGLRCQAFRYASHPDSFPRYGLAFFEPHLLRPGASIFCKAFLSIHPIPPAIELPMRELKELC